MPAGDAWGGRLAGAGDLGQLVTRDQVGHGTHHLDAAGDGATASDAGDQVLDHAGHHHQPPQMFGFDGVQDAVDVKARDHNDLAAEAQHMDALVGGGHVEHRRPGDEDIARRKLEIDAACMHAGDLRAVADQGALRVAGGAAGVEDDVAVLGIGCDGGFAGGRAAEALFVVVTQLDGFAADRAKPGGGGGVGGGDEGGFRGGQSDAVAQFGVGEAPVQCANDGADLARREHQFQVFRSVFRQDGDAVAPGDVEAAQNGGEPVHPNIERGIGELAGAVDDGDAIRVLAGPAAQHLADGQAGGAARGGGVDAVCHSGGGATGGVAGWHRRFLVFVRGLRVRENKLGCSGAARLAWLALRRAVADAGLGCLVRSDAMTALDKRLAAAAKSDADRVTRR